MTEEAKTRWNNPAPTTAAAEIESSPGDRAAKAARFIVVRHIPGGPRRTYLIGDNDHAPILAGVRDLTAACFKVLDAENEYLNRGTPDRVDLSAAIMELAELLADHGC